MRLREHQVTLQGERIFLRPMTEDDWDIVAKWETDPEIIHWADTSRVTSCTVEEVRKIFCKVSRHAYCFIIEMEGKPIGDGWLQEMNLARVLRRYRGRDCRRIDLVIGEKELWGRGLGADTIRTLTRFAFERENADMVFAIIGDYNERSQSAFMKSGYSLVMKLEEPRPSRARLSYVFAIDKSAFVSSL
jgi:RimJ/RimL family protein N-acetyltransferase